MLNNIRYCLVGVGVAVLFGCTSESETLEPAAPAATEAPVAEGGMTVNANAGGPPDLGGMGAGGMGAPPPELPIPDIDPSLVEGYKTVGDVELSVHIFNPAGHSPESSAPALIYFHGGGLRRGSPTQGYIVAERFLPEGVVVLAPEYRLLGTNTNTLDTIVADAKSVVRWVRANADRLGINPDQIVASGHSAGGFLSMAAGVVPGLDEATEDLSVSSVPDALVLWSSGETRRDNPENSMVPEGRTMAEFSAPKTLSSDLPPALFIHGDQDPIASPEAAVAFEARYREAGNQSSLHMIEGVDHFFAGDGQREQAYDLISGFLVSLGYLQPQ